MKNQRFATIDFVAPHPLDKCVSELQDTRTAEIEPTFERENSTNYKFRIRKLRRTRAGSRSSMVAANVSLRSLNANETAVVGKIDFSWSVIFTTLVFAMVVVVSLFMREWWLTLIMMFIVLSYWAFVWWDRQTLVGLVKRKLGET
jgi:hypothetical protein